MHKNFNQMGAWKIFHSYIACIRFASFYDKLQQCMPSLHHIYSMSSSLISLTLSNCFFVVALSFCACFAFFLVFFSLEFVSSWKPFFIFVQQKSVVCCYTLCCPAFLLSSLHLFPPRSNRVWYERVWMKESWSLNSFGQ